MTDTNVVSLYGALEAFIGSNPGIPFVYPKRTVAVGLIIIKPATMKLKLLIRTFNVHCIVRPV